MDRMTDSSLKMTLHFHAVTRKPIHFTAVVYVRDCWFIRIYCVFAYLQNKLYPREVDRNARGRIRVQLRNDDGTPVLPQFPSRQY